MTARSTPGTPSTSEAELAPCARTKLITIGGNLKLAQHPVPAISEITDSVGAEIVKVARLRRISTSIVIGIGGEPSGQPCDHTGQALATSLDLRGPPFLSTTQDHAGASTDRLRWLVLSRR